MATKSQPGNKFVVDLGGVTLADADRSRVAAAIQSAVLQFLAAHTSTPRSQISLVDQGGIAGMFVPGDDGVVAALRKR